MSLIKIKLNNPGARDLLKHGAIQADLRQRAQRMAATADKALERPGHEVRTHVGQNRARAIVITITHEARLAEARNRNLTRAIGAGR